MTISIRISWLHFLIVIWFLDFGEEYSLRWYEYDLAEESHEEEDKYIISTHMHMIGWKSFIGICLEFPSWQKKIS